MNPNKYIEDICSPEFIERQRKTLIVFNKLISELNKYNITYWLGYGTLIGCLRHQGFIPWDDDLDICVPKKYKNILLETKMNINITFSNVDNKLYRAHDGEYSQNIPQVDIFIIEENNQKTVGRSSELTESEIYPLKKTKFNNIDCFIPNQPENWFERKYGGKNPIRTCLLWNHNINSYWSDNFEIFKYEFEFEQLDEKWKTYIL